MPFFFAPNGLYTTTWPAATSLRRNQNTTKRKPKGKMEKRITSTVNGTNMRSASKTPMELQPVSSRKRMPTLWAVPSVQSESRELDRPQPKYPKACRTCTSALLRLRFVPRTPHQLLAQG
jgi:hypothetical protein